jgi:hypothetical protein
MQSWVASVFFHSGGCHPFIGDFSAKQQFSSLILSGKILYFLSATVCANVCVEGMSAWVLTADGGGSGACHISRLPHHRGADEMRHARGQPRQGQGPAARPGPCPRRGGRQHPGAHAHRQCSHVSLLGGKTSAPCCTLSYEEGPLHLLLSVHSTLWRVLVVLCGSGSGVACFLLLVGG